MHWEGLKSRFEKFRNDELVVTLLCSYITLNWDGSLQLKTELLYGC